MTRVCHMGLFPLHLVIATAVRILSVVPYAGSVAVTLKLDQPKVFLEPPSTKNPSTVNVTFTCIANVTVSDGLLALTYIQSYGENTNVTLAKTTSRDGWTTQNLSPSHHTTVVSVSCTDAGLYICALYYAVGGNPSTYSHEKEEQNLTVTVKPGPVDTDGMKNLVLVAKNSSKNVALRCRGTVGTTGGGEKTVWVWEYKDKNTLQWTRVHESGKFSLHTNPFQKYGPCLSNQTSTLTFEPELSDGNRSYRCYLQQNRFNYHEKAHVFWVNFSATSDPPTSTKPFDRFKRSISINRVVYVLLTAVFVLLILLVISAFFIIRYKRNEKNALSEVEDTYGLRRREVTSGKTSSGFLHSLRVHTDNTLGPDEETMRSNKSADRTSYSELPSTFVTVTDLTSRGEESYFQDVPNKGSPGQPVTPKSLRHSLSSTVDMDLTSDSEWETDASGVSDY